MTWLVCMCKHNSWLDSFICANITRTCLVFMCGGTHFHVWYDWFICANMTHDVTHFCVQIWLEHDSSSCVTWLIYMCKHKSWLEHDSFHVWRDSFICASINHDVTRPYKSIHHRRRRSRIWHLNREILFFGRLVEVHRADPEIQKYLQVLTKCCQLYILGF